MREPYYQDSAVMIYHGDCREILPELPKIDFVLTDPPYGINYKPRGGNNIASSIHQKRRRASGSVHGDTQPFDPTFLLSFPHIALFGAQHYYSLLPSAGTLHVW